MSGGLWVASYVVLWMAVVCLGFAVVVLLRQIGVLHARLAPLGVHFAGEGLAPGTPAPLAEVFAYDEAGLTVLAFLSSTCVVCAELRPSLAALAHGYPELTMHPVEHSEETAPVFRAFGVSSTPYVLAVDRLGVVRGRGVPNSLEQLEELVAEALAHAASSGGR